jgi:hypothetical protein
MSLSVGDTFNLPDHKRRKFRLIYKPRGKYHKVRRPRRTRDELVRFLRERNIKASRQVDLVRVEGDPTLSDFRLAFPRWRDAVELAFGRQENVGPPTDPEYVGKIVTQFGLWHRKDYLAARKLRPDVIPSYQVIRRKFGGYRRLVLLAKRCSTVVILNEYLVLKRRLGRVPTLKECYQANIRFDKAMEFFGSKRKIDAFLDTIRRPE